MGNWGDDIDEELQQKYEPIKVPLLFSFKSMSLMLQRIEEETREWDNKYPKSELLKIWTTALLIILVLITISYNVLIVATGFFMLFYGYILLQIARVWKRFKYSLATYWLMTLAALAGVFVIGINLQTLFFS